MALQVYTLVTVLVDGALLTEESQVSVDRDSRAQEVATTAKGFAGFSPGAPITRIEVDNAVPSSDFELNPGKFFTTPGDLIPCEITLFAASRTLTSKGFVIKDTLRHGVNAEARISFSFVGEPADWQ